MSERDLTIKTAHKYGNIDEAIVVYVINDDLPRLKSVINNLLSKYSYKINLKYYFCHFYNRIFVVMKKLIVLLLFILSTSLLLAQTNQVRIVLKNGTVVSGILKTFDSSSHAIVIISGLETKIPIDKISYIDDKFENPTDSIVFESQQGQDAVYIDREKLKNFKGFLLERGNNVYIYGDDNDYCKVGVANLRKLLKRDGFWNVVNSLEDAHFTLSYSVNFWKRDHVTLSVSSWRTNESFLLKVSKQWDMENVDKHANIALGLYQTEIVPLQTSIDEGKVKRAMKKKFTIE